jgi:RND family efflux transporter MFP subunit
MTLDTEHTPTTPTRRSLRRGKAIAALAALSIVGGALAMKLHRPADKAAPPSATAIAAPALELLPQDLVRVERGEIRQSITLTGTLQPLNRVDVKAPIPGQVVQVNAREGEHVRKGQVLATLDTTDLQTRLRERQGALEAGQAQLELATKTRDSNAALLKQNFISQAAFDNALSGDRAAEATVKSLRAQVEQARKALGDAVVSSPMDGIVSARLAEPGLSVPVNATLMTVLDLRDMELEVLVPTSQIPSVRIGQSASFGIEGFGDRRFEGKVERISPSAANGSRSIAVYLRIANPQQQLRGGMFAQGAILTERSDQVLVLPEAALRDQAGAASVLRIHDDRLQDQPVELGARDANAGLVEIVSGLQVGDRVVLSSAANLKAGLAVQIVTPLARAGAAQPGKKS